METLWQDIRYGARMLARNPGFTAVAVVTLALGIGANTAIFTVVNGVLLRPLPYSDPAKIVIAGERQTSGSIGNVGFTTLVDWRVKSRTIEHFSAFRFWNPSLVADGTPERIRGLRVSSSFFRALGVNPASGRHFLPEEDRPNKNRVVLLSHGLWQSRFGGDPEILGRSVTLSHRNYTVVGILPADYQPVVSKYAYGEAEIWSPLGYDVSQPWGCRGCRHLRALGRLAPGVTLEEAQAEMDTLQDRLRRDHPETYGDLGVGLARLHDRIVGSVRPALLVLLGAVGFVLLISCANVANLLLAQAAQRSREFAIRAALGAGRRRVLRQLMTESFLLSALGGAGGLLLALWGVDTLFALSPANLPRLEAVHVDIRVFTFAILTTAATGLLFGSAAAFQSSRPDLNEGLKQGSRSTAGRRSQRLRSSLVAAETSLALVLLIGGTLLMTSFLRLSRVNPGFLPANLLTLTLELPGTKYPEARHALEVNQRIAERIKGLPGVESVGWVSNLPLSGNHDRYGMPIEGRPDLVSPNLPDVERYVINPEYLRAMQIPIFRGRSFTTADDLDSTPVALINQSMANRFWPDEDPLGKRIQLGFTIWRTIVGIVGDVRHYGLESDPTLQAYVPQAQSATYDNWWVIRTAGGPAKLVNAVRNQVWSVDPDQPVVDIATMTQLAAATIAQRRFTMLLLVLFATVALLLAAIGIYGVLSYGVNQRTHEMGIRMALGARPADILKLAVGQGMVPTVVGAAVGLAGAFPLTRFLESFLFGVTATDPATFAGVTLFLTGVALLACYVPARRAAKVDPMVALRYE